jgi:diacylglycerol kinase family enzyme
MYVAMKTIGIIVNYRSRRNRRARRNPVDLFNEIGGSYVDVRATQSIDEIGDVVKIFMEDNVPIIAASGGDGTIHHTVTQIIRIYEKSPLPQLLILKGGTMNNISRSISLRGSDVSILRRAIETLQRGREMTTYRRGTMKVGDSYCFLFGNGLTADFLTEYYARGKSYTSLVRFIVQTIARSMRGSESTSLFKGFRGRIYVDNELLDSDHFLGILAGTVEHIGMGFSPLPRANEQESTFQVIVNGMKPFDLARSLLKLKRGIPIDDPHNFDGVVQKLRIEIGEKFLYTMDGDLFESDGVINVEVGPSVQLVYV